MRLRIPTIYSQWDARWNTEMLGFNTQYPYNIHNYGCLITCIAMVSKYYGKEDTPSTINQKLKSKNKFVGGGLYVWGGINAVYSGITEKLTRTPSPLSETQMNEIKGALDKGYPVMIQLDYNPNTVDLDMHYVLAIGYNPDDEADITIADPLGGGVVSLKKYIKGFSNTVRKVIYQYIIYEGKVPAQSGVLDPPTITWDELKVIQVPKENFEGNKRTVEFYFNEWEVEKKEKLQLQKQLIDEEKECEQKVFDARVDEQIKCNQQIGLVMEEHKKEVEKMTSNFDSKELEYQNSINTLTDEKNTTASKLDGVQGKLDTTLDELKTCKSKKCEDMDVETLIRLLISKLFNK